MNYPDDFIDKIIQGNVLDVIKDIPDNSIDTIITSPPYWGLRDYGEETNTEWNDGWYGQLGLEPTLDMYIDHMLQITVELKRVLKKTGVMFWNHGDCYGGGGNPNDRKLAKGLKIPFIKDVSTKPKCLALQNYRTIIRMIDEQGWILRNTIIWNKPNHMPSSVKDRFANAYEPVFMLVKNKKYYFDLDAVRVPHKESTLKRSQYGGDNGKWGTDMARKSGFNAYKSFSPGKCNFIIGKNPGDVWTIPTQPFPEAHFATYPEKLITPMIKAGCPQWICKKCGKARVRITKTIGKERVSWGVDKKARVFGNVGEPAMRNINVSVGWTDCGCNAGWDAGIVLDPFAGSGTTCYVARKLGRYYIGIEINPEYVKMAKKRLANLGARLEKYF